MATVTNFANAFETTLTADMAATDLVASVQSTDRSPASPCYLVIDPYDPDKREYILFDGSFTTTTFSTTTIDNRYLDGSSAASGITHPAGSIVRFSPVAQHFRNLHGRIDSKANDADVVKLAGAQTISGAKTFSVDPTLADGSSALSQTEGNAAYVASGAGATAFESTFETTTSTTFTALATAGPSVTVNVGSSGLLYVEFGAWLKNDTAGQTPAMSAALSGANTSAASLERSLAHQLGNSYIAASSGILYTGLAAGSTTVTSQYSVTGGTGTFGRRRLVAYPL